MKILHINSLPVYGGAEIYLKSLSASLAERGHDSIFCYTTAVPAGYRRKENEYFIGDSQGVRTGLRVVGRLRDIINRKDPDIIHLHSSEYNTSPVLIREMRRLRPTVYTVHNILGFCPKDPTAERLERRSRILSTGQICDRPFNLLCLKNRCIPINSPSVMYTLFLRMWRIYEYKRLNRVVVHSRFVRETLLRQGFSVDRLLYMRMFIPVERQWHREPLPDDRTIMFIGSLSRAKGIFEFLKSLDMIKDTEYRAVIVGDGYCYRDVIREIENMNLSSRVILKGWMPHEDLHHYYNMASVVVMPTMCPESLGIVGLESLYFGRPVVAFDSGGIREWLRDGINGRIVPFNDTVRLAESLRQILTDSGMRLRLSENAIKTSRQFLCRDTHADRMLEIYREVRR